MKILLPLLLTLLTSPAFATEKLPIPRFVSLRACEANLRVGPGPNYPVEWTYMKAGLPVEIVAEFDNWRKIRDVAGAEGWVHQSMLTSKRHGLIKGNDAILYQDADNDSEPLARLQEGVVVHLVKCKGDWCQVKIDEFKGWVPRASIWGIYLKEEVR